MKFDCIVMNPPYIKNLHLKILAEAIKHLNDEKSKCVCLHPPQEYKKFKQNPDKRILSFDKLVDNAYDLYEQVDKGEL